MTERIAELPFLPRRKPDTHKGTYGHVLVVGGSLGMTGAAALASEAALRAGAGLVTCACPGHVNAILEVKLTEAMTWPLPIDREGCLGQEAIRVLKAALDRYSALVIGPGLGRHETTKRFVQSLLDAAAAPVVVDADALNVLADGYKARDNMVLTPHPGEFGRIIGKTSRQVQADREKLAVSFAADHEGVLVLKGHRTIVAQSDRLYVNETGNPGMATGGAGDVLSGLIGGLLAQGLAPFDAACLGVWLHGRAGDLACAELGEESLLAGDIIRHLPGAFSERKEKAPPR